MDKRITVTKDTVSRVVADINALVRKQVLVGIPDSTTDRQQEIEQGMTNATLGYIHEFGSPKRNIPARPFLIPGVEKARDPAIEKLKQAAQATMRGDKEKADKLLNDAGIIGMGGAKGEISWGEFVPLSPSTVRNRHRSRGTKSMRDAERIYLSMIARGVSPEEAQNVAGIRPLINTGQLRNALTYVVREK